MKKVQKLAIWAATSQEAGNYNGTYFEKCKPASISSEAEDTLKASILWEESIKMTNSKWKTDI